MKQQIKIKNFVIFFIAFFLSSMLNAQVSEPIIDTVKIQQTVVVHDTVRKATHEKKLYNGEFGLRYLPTFTSLNVRSFNGEVIHGKAEMSHGFGIMLALNLSKHFGIQAEINYDQISQKYKDQELDRQININYINIPLQLLFSTNKTGVVSFNVVVGPQFGLNIGSDFDGDNKSDKDSINAELAVKEGDVGVAYGAGFGIAFNEQRNFRLDFGFRGLYGLVDMSGTPEGDNSYNILVKGSRKSYGRYVGITCLF